MIRGLISVLCAIAGAAAAETGPVEILKTSVLLVTNDAPHATEFYRDVIGLKLLASGQDRARFQAGSATLEILASKTGAHHYKDEVEGAVGIRAVALFLAGPDEFNARLKAHGYPEARFVTPNPGSKVARVKDPDGNFVELIFPDDPTPAKLSHIAVAMRMPDVERSKEFYGKTLGLKVIPPHGDPANLSYGFAFGNDYLFVKRIPAEMPNHGGAPADAVGYRAVTLTVRDLAAAGRFLKGRGLKIVDSNPGSLTIVDPDGIALIFVAE